VSQGTATLFFHRLRDIAQKDEIRMETPDAVYVYKVESSTVVKPSDVVVLKPGLYPEVTLVTCYPFTYAGSAPERFVVKARQVAQIPLVQAASTQEDPTPMIPDSERSVPTPVAPAVPQVKRNGPADGNSVPIRRITFEVGRNRSRELAPGISLGLTSTDPTHRTVDAWLWLMPDKRAIWLRDQSEGSPVGSQTAGRSGKWKLVVTQVSQTSVRGYLMGQ